jgi:alkylated DNA nucleotide flippase Atl1
MAKKSFNEKLHDNKNIPEIIEVTDPKAVVRFGGTKMLIAPPLAYDEIMKKVPYGKVITADYIRNYLAKKHAADYTCSLTAGIFMNIAAKASVERGVDETPYWRTLKKDGELNEKFPDGIEGHKALLEVEGHTIVQKGKRYFLMDFADKRFELE